VSTPRQTGQLDQISERLGELAAYTHEHRHGVNNLSQKFDALALDVTKRMEAFDTKVTVRMDEIYRTLTAENVVLKARVEVLETAKHQQDGAWGLVKWITQNWPMLIGFFVMIAVILRSTGQI
jgi:ribosomal protein L16 Arg81 hydroxylase